MTTQAVRNDVGSDPIDGALALATWAVHKGREGDLPDHAIGKAVIFAVLSVVFEAPHPGLASDCLEGHIVSAMGVPDDMSKLSTTEARLVACLEYVRELRRRCEAADAALERARQNERRLAATKGVVTRIKNRVGKGVCPCCKRTFPNLGAHMSEKHPDWAPETES